MTITRPMTLPSELYLRILRYLLRTRCSQRFILLEVIKTRRSRPSSMALIPDPKTFRFGLGWQT
jgi:hypothetical protein